MPVLPYLPVRPYVPRGPNTTVGVIRGVDIGILEDDLMKYIPAAQKVIQVRRFSSSLSVKTVSAGESLPSHVKVGLIRYPVRPYVPRASRCFNCWAVGHVIRVCNKAIICSRCGGSHEDGTSVTQTANCVNCHGAHNAKSNECLRLKKESAVLMRMTRENSTRRVAIAALRRKRSRRQHRVKPSFAIPQLAEPTQSSPPHLLEKQHPSQTTKNNRNSTLGNPGLWPSLPPTALKAAHPAATQRARESAAIVNDASDQQIRDMLRFLVCVLHVLIGRKQTLMAVAAVQFIDSLLPILAPRRRLRTYLFASIRSVMAYPRLNVRIPTVLQWNVNGFKTPLPDLRTRFHMNPIDILVLQESRVLAHDARLAGYVGYHSKPHRPDGKSRSSMFVRKTFSMLLSTSTCSPP